MLTTRRFTPGSHCELGNFQSLVDTRLVVVVRWVIIVFFVALTRLGRIREAALLLRFHSLASVSPKSTQNKEIHVSMTLSLRGASELRFVTI